MKIQFNAALTSFKSKLPPKQEKEMKSPEPCMRLWAKDYWNSFAINCEELGLGDEFIDCMQKIKSNNDDGILVMDRYLSGFGADNYVIGLYDSVEDIEKDRIGGLDRIKNTRNGRKHLYYTNTSIGPRFHDRGLVSDKKIVGLEGKTHTECLLSLLKRIANPASEEARYIGINPIPKGLRTVAELRIKK